ncbi:SGNH hydrolase [Kibdelosporangium philippinense]
MPIRRLIVPTITVALLATGATLTHTASAAASTPPTAPAAAKPPEVAAFEQARKTGQPVEVEGQQTTNTTVTADPDGQFTYRATTRPERVQQDGQWRAIDTTLSKHSDGLYRPIASTANVAFSGGGTSPLVTLSSGDKKLSLSWPTPLPTPTVQGSSATYPAVLPGVDLHITATSDSYRKTLIVHNATAAKNPALTAITLNATTSGLTLNAGPDGTLNASDTNGKPVFVGSTPLMWDSRHEPGQPAPTADAPGNTTHIKLDVTPTGGNGARVTITPDHTALLGQDVVYPVYIDPTTGDIGPSDWGNIADNGFKNYRDTYARVGRCYRWAECAGSGNWVARSYFVMPTNALQSRNGRTAVIRSATFTITNTHTGNNRCNQVQAMWADLEFTSQTSWPGPGGLHDMDVARDACPGASVHYNAIDAANALVSANAGQITIGLRSANEGAQNQDHWNRFANNPAFAIRFAFPPGQATNKGVSRLVKCDNKSFTPDRFPTLYATAADNNAPPLNLLLYFHVWTGDGNTLLTTSPGIEIASGSTAAWQVSTDLGDGEYVFRVTVQNTGGDGTGGLWNGSYSIWSPFRIQSTPPAFFGVKSPDYAENYWSQGAGRFRFNSSYSTAGFAYSFSGPGTIRVPKVEDCNYNQTFPNGGWVAADANGNAIDVPVIPATMAPGYHTLHVRAFDKAHNLSADERAYTFYVAPNYGVPTRINPGDPAQVAVAQPAGQNIPLSQQDNRVHFRGTAEGQSFTMEFTAPIEADYALGLNVRLKQMDGGAIAVALDGVAKPDIRMFDVYGRLGGVHLTKGKHVITLTTGESGEIQAPYDIDVTGIDAVPLNNVTANSFADAMNNDGISNDGITVAADKSLDLDGGSLSAQTLAAAGLTPGSSLTVQGATFTLPAPNKAGNDNVIAIGQTIPLPAAHQVPANAIGLLAVSTCGANPTTPAAITYTDGTTDKQQLVALPDWALAPHGVATPVATLPYRNTGATRDTVHKPTVYAVFLPANPLKTVQKITLPNIGTAFRRTCLDNAALHVLAMAPRPVTPPDGKTWAGAWSAPADNATAPPSGGFADKTLRVIAHPAITGAEARIRLSNTGSPTPVTFDAATIAAHTTGPGINTPTTFTFGGNTTVTIPAGGDVHSDPVALPTGGSGNIAVSLHLPQAVTAAPTHTSNGTTTYVASGNATRNQDTAAFPTSLPSTHYLTGIDVTTAPGNGTVAVLADQNTRAPGTFTGWSDTLATQLGNQLPGGLVTTTHTTPPPPGWWTALNQTTLAGPRLRTAVVTLGAQDILNGDTPQAIQDKLTGLIRDINGINRYKRPDGARIHIVLATIAPLGLDPTSTQEKNRQQLNATIINQYRLYGANELINIDQALRDTTNPSKVKPEYLTGGVPNNTYYQRIAQTVHTEITNGTVSF